MFDLSAVYRTNYKYYNFFLFNFRLPNMKNKLQDTSQSSLIQNKNVLS